MRRVCPNMCGRGVRGPPWARGSFSSGIQNAPYRGIGVFERGCASSSGAESKLGRAMGVTRRVVSVLLAAEGATDGAACGLRLSDRLPSAHPHQEQRQVHGCTVWTSETPEESAWMLARWRLDVWTSLRASSPGKKRNHKEQMGCARLVPPSTLLVLTCPPSLIADVTSRKAA